MRRVTAPLAALAIVTAACSGGSAATSPSPRSVSLTVFAASSLTGAFSQIGKDFEAANPGTKVVFSFGPSDGLAGQIASEGTADVFASASGTWMDAVAKDPGVTDRVDFARNRLVIITPTGNPAGVAGIDGLAHPGVRVVLAASGVPVGDYAREVLKSAGLSSQVLANVVSNEPDDASMVQKIVSGEADAAIVYASDLTSTVAPDVHAVKIPDAVNVTATYPIAVIEGTAHPAVAADFVDFVTSSAGQTILGRFGFLPP